MRQQRGMALLSVLLVLTLALLLVEGVVRQQRVMVAATTMQLETIRLRQALLEGEARLLAQLPRWEGSRPEPVHVGQPWAQPQAWTLKDGIYLQGAVTDLAGRFNLQWLARPSGLEPFRRLLQVLELKAVSWPEGPLPAWRELSQARLLTGVSRPWLTRLAPYAAWMPEAARINVNTVQAPVLASLGIPMDVALRLERERPSAGFSTVQAWRNQPALQGLSVQAGDLAVGSRWFRLELAAQADRRRLRLLADVELAATDGHPRVLRRWLRAIEEEAPSP